LLTTHGEKMEKLEENSVDQRRAYYWDKVRKYCEKRKDFNWPSTELILNLVYTHDIVRSFCLKDIARFNLSDSAMNILMILYFGEGKGYMQQELGNLLLVSRANITKVIDGLEKRGLVIRSASEEDRRARYIKLTAAGEVLAKQIIPIQSENSIKAGMGLSTTDKNNLNKLLTKLSLSITQCRNVKKEEKLYDVA